MSVADFLRSYDAEVRAKPTARHGLTAEDDGFVVRLVGSFNFICSWRFAAAEARSVVEWQAQHFRALGQPLIWRVHEHDTPPGLNVHLAECGFEPSAPGTLMFLDLHNPRSPAAQDIDVRRVSTEEGLADFLAASDQAFGERQEGDLYEPYLQRMRDPTFALFVAYAADAPVASARLEWSGRFGQFYGGGVHPLHRGRGVYRALVHARAEEAERQGLRYLSTEARETSRPILERLGFTAAAREVTWVLRA
jgi:GNAT superfamily N-acetyltransferase